MKILVECSLELLNDALQVQVRVAARLDGGTAADERVLERVLAAGHQHASLDGGGLRSPCHEHHVGAWSLSCVVVHIGYSVTDVVFRQQCH